MIEIGKFNLLKLNRLTLQGYYLVCPDQKEVLLPNKYIPENAEEGALIDVFVYTDSEDRIVATTIEPYVIVGEFAYMEVKDVTPHGAFLDWGLEKDLFVPLREQRTVMQKGKSYIVYAYLDEMTNRMVATTKYNHYLETENTTLKENEEVEILVTEKTDLGYTVIINDQAKGLLFENEIHEPINIGNRKKAYIKTIRPDNKIDVVLQKAGIEHIDHSSQKILSKLQENGGYLPLGDHSTPDEINLHFAMSKKVFKKAIGILYKNKKIAITQTGIQSITQ